MAIYIGGTGSANKFEDYEEGSWTPVFQAYDYNNSNAWTDVSYDNALDYTTARYTKIGQLCQVWYYSGAFSLDSGYNHLSARINGLPFQFRNNDPYYGGVFVFTHTNCFKNTSNNLFDCHGGYGRYNETYVYPNIGNSADGARWGSESARYLMFSGIYETDT